MVIEVLIGIFSLFWDFFYWIKWAASVVALQLRKKTQRRRFDLYDFEDENHPEKWGIVAPEEEITLESPFSEEHLQSAGDEIFFYGVNSNSESLLVRIARACNDESEAWVYLKLSDGRWYELEQTSGFQRNFGKCTSFTCGGLQMKYLAPMRRWRITYCGMLRERKTDRKEDNKPVFVKFTFLWTASSDVYDASYDLDMQATAVAMAQAKWNCSFPPTQKLVESLNFYAQSGIINGTVSVEDEPDKEMYLFGERTRYTGKSSSLVGCKFKHILGVVPESGLILHLGKASLPNAFHNLYFGFIVNPDGLVYVIEDGHIISNLTGSDAEGKNLKVMFKAGRQYELCGNFIGYSLRFANKQGWDGHIELTGIEFEVDELKGSGFMISGEVSGERHGKMKRNPCLSLSQKPLTVYFTDDVSHSTELTGGKGSSLGKLTKLSKEIKSQEFIVPRGIVVTTAAYEQFLTCEIIEKIENLKNIAYGNVKGDIHEACKMVASAIENTHFPDKIEKEIEEKLNKLFDSDINEHKVAVRSSATGEDTDEMSAAGQMDTFLGVRGLKEIFAAVKKCWASQFSYIATEYKRQNCQVLNSSMAVVIQEMVECDAAGVLFTCDPVTNNPSVIVMNGNYGLGESVVSGSEDPDTVLLDKLANGEVKVKSMMVGTKQHRIVMKGSETSEEEDKTITEELSEEEKNKCCISEETALRLGRISLEIENYFKSPQDIEWGIKKNIIYMLQSRPITTDGAVTDYEIKHEFDGPLRCKYEFFTRANTEEVVPGAVSPLGLDILMKFFTMVFDSKEMRKRQRNTYHQSKYFPTGSAPFCNHIHLSIPDILTRQEEFDSVAAQGMMLGIFGRVLDDPELLLIFKHRKYKPLKRGFLYYPIYLKNLFFSGHGIEKIKERVFNYQNPALKGRTSNEIFNLLIPSCNQHVALIWKHMICSEMSSLWNMFMFGVLEKAKGCVDNEVYSDFAKLLASSSNVESADVPSALQDLANTITKDIDGNVFREMSTEEAIQWLETSNNTSNCKYQAFLKRHGHRCLKEFDMISVPWNTNPKPLIKTLQKTTSCCEGFKEKKEQSLRNILSTLTVPLNLKSKLLLRFIWPNCCRGVRDREACKSILIKTFDNTRKAFEHLSKTMVAEGYLPNSNLIYFLTIDEIRDLLELRSPGIIARARHRRKLLPIMDALKFPIISKGLPVPITDMEEEKFEYVADLTMKGIPVSQGSVKGYARVAISLEEASYLKPGEILITYSTDIGWSPYFPIVAGVVTEIGGLISHGAVISREYGLPCIVGLRGVTKQFVTGDYVLLDGNKGILQRLSPPEN